MSGASPLRSLLWVGSEHGESCAIVLAAVCGLRLDGPWLPWRSSGRCLGSFGLSCGDEGRQPPASVIGGCPAHESSALCATSSGPTHAVVKVTV